MISKSIRTNSVQPKSLIQINPNQVFSPTLSKVSDRNSFRVNQNYSDTLGYMYPSQCESFRTNPKPSFQSRSIRSRIDFPNESE